MSLEGARVERRKMWMAVAALLLIVAVGTAVALLSGGDETQAPQDARSDDAGTESPVVADDGASSASAPETGTLTETIASSDARRRASSVKDTPRPPKDLPEAPADDNGDDTDDGLTEEQRKYLEETRQIVETGEADLQAAAARILEAIIAADGDALEGYLAADEGAQLEYIGYLAERYPTIIQSAPGSTVNIFSVNDATIYFAYAIVRWEDAGLTSEHTISIPMRFVDGEWRLTSLDESTTDLQFVQAVQL